MFSSPLSGERDGVRSRQLCLKGMRNSVTNPPYDLSSSLLKYVEKLWGSLFLNTTMAQQPTKEILFLTLNGEILHFKRKSHMKSAS